MSPEEAIQIITDEELYIVSYNWFEDKRAVEDEVGIIKKENQWLVYTASERANPSDIKSYDVIEESLDDFIQRMRDSKKIVQERLIVLDERDKQKSWDAYLFSLNDRKQLDEKDKQEWLSKKDCIYQMKK